MKEVIRLEADIAGIAVALTGPDRFERVLTERFRPFPARSAPSIQVELREHAETCAAEPEPLAGAFHADVAGGRFPDYPVELAFAGTRVHVTAPFADGWVDTGTREGRAIACSRDAIGGVENFLRVAVAHLLLERGGFLLHACSVIGVDGNAIVGFGESGAGKTTLAGLAGSRPVVSDDLVALIRDSRGRLAVVPAPFRPGGAHARPEGHPVRALFSLAKGGTAAIEPLSRAAGAASIVASMPFVLDREQTAARALALADAAASDPGVARLTFAPITGAWDSIEGMLS